MIYIRHFLKLITLCVVMVLWLVVNRNPDDFATAFAVEALVGEVVWTAYMCRLDISCDCVYCGLVG